LENKQLKQKYGYS